jgi:hypothetical protein
VRGFLVAAALVLGPAATPPGFDYDPKPRWADDPETEIVCSAIRAECKGIMKNGGIDAEWRYAEYYDADGMLVGIHSLGSTGCKPLDEHLLLGHRHFRTTFSGPGKPDLDEVRVELAQGISKNAVRLVKSGSTEVSITC